MEDRLQQFEQMLAALQEQYRSTVQQLEQLKAELSEKIHSENVKCFRNIQDIFKSMGDKIDKVSEVDRSVKTVHTFVVTTMIFTIINTVGALVTILALLGVF